MADKEFNVSISAETHDFTNGMNEAEKKSSKLGETLGKELSQGSNEATDSLSKTIEELRKLQKEAMGAGASFDGFKNAFNNTSEQSNKFNQEMQRLSMQLGGEVPESTQKAYREMMLLNNEARKASRVYGKYSQEALNARDAITKYALGLDDTTFKQIYMRSQLGLTDAQLRQQANSIKLNARMTKLMGNQTQILTQRMQGLQKAGVKPEMLLPPSTIGQFQMLNETMAAGGASVNKLSLGYRILGNRMEKTIKGWSAQKMAIKAANGDMVKYGILQRGITAGMMNMTMAFPLVGMGAMFAYKTMFGAALKADESLKSLADTVKGNLTTAFAPLIETAGQFLRVALNIINTVAQWVIQFNEAHPAIAKVLSVIGFLIPAMTMLLLPLGLGIGLFNGWKIVINFVWTAIGGLVTMIGTASATFLTLASIVAGVVLAFLYLWKTNEGFREACTAIWESIKLIISTALESIKQWFIDHSETIKQTIETAYNIIKTIISTTLQALSEIISFILSEIKRFWDEHGESIKKAVSTIYEFIKNLISTYLQTVSEIISRFLSNVKKWWNENGESVKKIIQNTWDTIKKIFSIAMDIIGEIVELGCDIINGDWESAGERLGKITDLAWEAIKNIIKWAIENIPEIIKAGISFAVEAMGKLLEDVLKAAIEFKDKLVDAGKDLMKGLAKGIMNGASSVVKSITGAIGDAIDAGKKLLGINSPSKLFMQFGEWTTEGYEIGVNRGEPKSTRAVENFANRSINAFSMNALPQNNENTSMDNSTYNININAGSLNNEEDLYKLAELIDRKLFEIKRNKNKMFGGYQGV